MPQQQQALLCQQQRRIGYHPRCRGCPGLPGQVNSSLTITGPGHDGVIQETIINPDSNEAVISVPAHGNNMAQEVVLQGRGGSNEVSSPLLAYIREGACYVADLPDDINPSDNLRESRQASIDSAETEDLYYIHDEFSQIEEERNCFNILIYLYLFLFFCRDPVNTTNCQTP